MPLSELDNVDVESMYMLNIDKLYINYAPNWILFLSATSKTKPNIRTFG